jgi:hypothetical protein
MALLCILLILLICSAGCLTIPSGSHPPANITLPNVSKEVPVMKDTVPGIIPNKTVTPSPEPTSLITHADSMSRTFNFNPPPRVSVGYANTTDIRVIPHTIYTENGLELNGTPLKRLLTILYGPFIVDFTTHPKVNNPIYAWATIEVDDPWGNRIADGGYNRKYPAATSQQMIIYRTGNYSVRMDGNFVTMDIGVRTTDPVPVTTQTTEPEEEE